MLPFFQEVGVWIQCLLWPVVARGRVLRECGATSLSRGGNRLMAFHDQVAQGAVDPSLIALSLFLEPSQHVGVDTQGDGFLDRAVELSELGREVARQSFSIR